MPVEQTDLTLSKKRSLDEGEEENVENPSEENDNDDSEKVSRKKKSRWGNEEEIDEKQSVIKPTSDEEDRDYHRSSSKYDDDRSYNNRRMERYFISLFIFSVQNQIDNFIFRSPEKELPLPEEETVQFNPEDVVLDFCKSTFSHRLSIDFLLQFI